MADAPAVGNPWRRNLHVWVRLEGLCVIHVYTDKHMYT